jgi:uncharacterized protein (TIGR02145 family)
MSEPVYDKTGIKTANLMRIQEVNKIVGCLSKGYIMRIKYVALLFLSIVFFTCQNSLEIKGTVENPYAIFLSGRVMDKDGKPVANSVARLVEKDLSDTTDADGYYQIIEKNDGASLHETLDSDTTDTLQILKESQVITVFAIKKWIDTLPDVFIIQCDIYGKLASNPDVFIIQRDIYGNLASKPNSIGEIKAIIVGDNISDSTPKQVVLRYNEPDRSYSGFAYFVYTEKVLNYSVYVDVYDSLRYSPNGRHVLFGRSVKVDFLSSAGDINVPLFDPQNANPTVDAGKDTIVEINDTIKLHGVAADSFEGHIAEYRWKLGASAWVTTSRGDTNITAPATEQAYVCSLFVMDDQGNISEDAIVITVEPRSPKAKAGTDTSVFVNSQVLLRGSSSYDRARIVLYAWKCGNDNWAIVPSGDTVVTAPSTEQAWVCSLKVVDDHENISIAQKTITVMSNVTDIDGNQYDVVKIGSQSWTVQNLRTTRYNDGTAIVLATDNTEWSNKGAGTYCFYDNSTDSAYQQKWGALYNWYAVNTGKLAPAGWHVPTDAEWNTLSTYCGGDAIAGIKLKVKTGWYNGENGTDEFRFSALPGGYRNSYGYFNSQSYGGYWWSATEYDASNAYYRCLGYNDSGPDRSSNYKTLGFSVRLVRDSVLPE